MTTADVLSMIRESLKDCACPNSNEHVYKLALAIYHRTKDDDALAAEQYSAEVAAAIRNA